MSDLISIIIPVYNVEKYLDRCLDSVTNQTYRNLEIILVDDGSTDSSLEMCKSWEKKDERIKVFHKENGGLSDARNYGVSKSKADYVFFLDSDDCISTKTIKILYDLLLEHGADISCCNYVKFSTDEPEYSYENSYLVLDGGTRACETMMCKKTFMITAWANLIKRKIVEKYQYPVGRYQEDEATTYKFFYDSKKTVVIDAKLYGYYVNAKGITKSSENHKKNVLDLLQSLKEQLSFYEQKNEKELVEHAYARYTRCYFEAYSKNYIQVEKKEAKLIAKLDIKNSKETLKFKILLRLFLLFGKKALRIKYK